MMCGRTVHVASATDCPDAIRCTWLSTPPDWTTHTLQVMLLSMRRSLNAQRHASEFWRVVEHFCGDVRCVRSVRLVYGIPGPAPYRAGMSTEPVSPGDPRHSEFPEFLMRLGAATYEAARVAGICFDSAHVLGSAPSEAMYNDPLGTLKTRMVELARHAPELPGLSEFLDKLQKARVTRNDLLHALPVRDGCTVAGRTIPTTCATSSPWLISSQQRSSSTKRTGPVRPSSTTTGVKRSAGGTRPRRTHRRRQPYALHRSRGAPARSWCRSLATPWETSWPTNQMRVFRQRAEMPVSVEMATRSGPPPVSGGWLRSAARRFRSD